VPRAAGLAGGNTTLAAKLKFEFSKGCHDRGHRAAGRGGGVDAFT
jgi:hypothetical protein